MRTHRATAAPQPTTETDPRTTPFDFLVELVTRLTELGADHIPGADRLLNLAAIPVHTDSRFNRIRNRSAVAPGGDGRCYHNSTHNCTNGPTATFGQLAGLNRCSKCKAGYGSWTITPSDELEPTVAALTELVTMFDHDDIVMPDGSHLSDHPNLAANRRLLQTLHNDPYYDDWGKPQRHERTQRHRSWIWRMQRSWPNQNDALAAVETARAAGRNHVTWKHGLQQFNRTKLDDYEPMLRAYAAADLDTFGISPT